MTVAGYMCVCVCTRVLEREAYPAPARTYPAITLSCAHTRLYHPVHNRQDIYGLHTQVQYDGPPSRNHVPGLPHVLS